MDDWVLDSLPTIEEIRAELMRRNLPQLPMPQSGKRTYPEQDALYAQGRTTPGSVVTHAVGGKSNHNFGVAYDITIFKNGQPVYDGDGYNRAAQIAKGFGLNWGGSWTGKGAALGDTDHFEYPTGLSLQEMDRRHRNGIPIIGSNGKKR